MEIIREYEIALRPRPRWRGSAQGNLSRPGEKYAYLRLHSRSVGRSFFPPSVPFSFLSPTPLLAAAAPPARVMIGRVAHIILLATHMWPAAAPPTFTIAEFLPPSSFFFLLSCFHTRRRRRRRKWRLAAASSFRRPLSPRSGSDRRRNGCPSGFGLFCLSLSLGGNLSG